MLSATADRRVALLASTLKKFPYPTFGRSRKTPGIQSSTDIAPPVAMFRLLGSAFPRIHTRLASTLAVPAARQIPAMIARPQNISLTGFKFVSPIVSGLTESRELVLSSVLRKRRLKMKKHKLRKRRKAQRALRIKTGK
ncbi:hypothetical protein KL929_001525 [Ogataea haglerorum]|nr:hypothetical protein KL929_001525 [Ogataea haglerorum]